MHSRETICQEEEYEISIIKTCLKWKVALNIKDSFSICMYMKKRPHGTTHVNHFSEYTGYIFSKRFHFKNFNPFDELEIMTYDLCIVPALNIISRHLYNSLNYFFIS